MEKKILVTAAGGFAKRERLHHVLGRGLVFLEMSRFEMRLVGGNIDLRLGARHFRM
jgi:hypothetical protein